MSLELFNYEEFLPLYPEIESPDFQQEILNKKEFYELQLKRNVKKPDEDGLLQHQKMIQRFLSPYTLYDELFIYHSTGTGKTGVAFAVTENLFHSKSFSKVIVLAKGESLLISHRKNLVEFYSNRYKSKILEIPKELLEVENINDQKEVEEVARRRNRIYKNLVSDFYEFRTFETFAKDHLLNVPNESLEKNYSNCIFILDEVHNIADEDKKEARTEVDKVIKKQQLSIYKEFHRLFHTIRNRKILLLSATPMRDDVSEIAYLMNLLLPLNKQLPTGKQFLREFVSGDKIINEDRLKDYFRGRMSILVAPSTNVKTVYKGYFLPPLNVIPFKLFKTTFESFQLQGYTEAHEIDSQRNSSIYNNVREAALFVFPDGSYGDKGYNTYASKRGIFGELAQKIRTIEGLRRYSCKYAYIIQNILDNPQKLVYIYCSVVNGSGVNLLSHILELYGFSRATGNETTKRRRYIALTSQIGNINKPLEFFNRPENMLGDYCQVIIGSKVISEGFTFNNIQIIHITTLFWNYTETQQAIARGVRYRSHSDLYRAGYRPTVEIYQHASFAPDPKVRSIDEMMMQFSQRKDILIRKMDRVIKEISFDCPLVYERNQVGDRQKIQNSRNCDYQACDYKCDESGLEPTEIDFSTYHLYYQNKDEDAILEGIRKLFQSYFRITLDAMQDILQVERFPLLRVLSYVIRYNIPLVNTYNIECYLREDHNEYYLVDNIVLPNQQSDLVTYTQNPFIVENKTLQDTIQNQLFQKQLKCVRYIQQAENDHQVKLLLERLPIEIQELYLEMAWIRPNIQLSRWIKHIYKDFIQNAPRQVEETQNVQIVSTLLSPRTRGFDSRQKVWRDCVLEEHKENIVAVDIENNPYGYYGIVEEDRFCIRDITQALSGNNIDKRKIKTGSNCLEVGFNKPKLAEICIHLGLPVPQQALHPNPRNELMKNRSGQKVLEAWNNWSNTELAKGLYWYSQSKKDLCDILKNWFAEHQLLVQDKCGTSAKTKT